MNSEALLRGLIEYQDSLQKHLAELRTDYAEMKKRTLTCSKAYEGGDAEDFWSRWDRTDQMFIDYELEVSKIIPMLEQRIQSLRRFVGDGTGRRL